MAQLAFPLYHGTCTLFLESIAQHGLGGRDPVKEWRVLECLRKVLPLAEKQAGRSEFIRQHLGTTRSMVAQVNAGLNFQHGAVYLSPSQDTAIRYACGKKKGSELISRTVLLIEELIRLNLGEVKIDLYHEFPEVFHLQDIDAAPVLIQVNDVSVTNLLSERGESPDDHLTKLRGLQVRFPDNWEQLSQQLNFRLLQPIPANELTVKLIAVRRWQQFKIEYGLLSVDLSPASGATGTVA